MLLQRITMYQAKLKGISKAAPMVYSNWYTYTALIDGILKDPFWARYERELRETDRLFVDFNLHKETAFLITTREKQLLLRNKGSPDNYMRVELAWLELPLPLVKKILG
ncbi:MAG: hypothetical protein EBY22_02690 [Gammaproteobacteria bacterium]|nr:hypothetical protein [Gammaproteobacteria bacterium]